MQELSQYANTYKTRKSLRKQESNNSKPYLNYDHLRFQQTIQVHMSNRPRNRLPPLITEE